MASGKLNAGDVGEAVTRVHEQLSAEGLEISPIEAARNLYGPGTRAAVTAFQKRNKLPVTGEVDAQTAAALAQAKQSASIATNSTLAPRPPNGASGRPGTKLADLTKVIPVGGASASVASRGESGPLPRAVPDDFVITGVVEFEDGSPAPGVRVDAYDRDLGRRRTRLGDAERPIVTGENGTFPAISYHASESSRGEGQRGPNADLVFEITGANDKNAREIVSLYRRLTRAGELREIPVPDLVLGFEAAQVEDVRIVIAGRPSERGLAEYGRLMLALEPLLLERTTPADFDQERCRDIDFSARETGWERALIETMMLAWQAAQAATTEPQLLAETLYGLLRGGPPTEVAALAVTLPELLDDHLRWRGKLVDSLEHRIIDGALDQHLERLRSLRTDAAVRSGDGRRGSIGDVLAYAGLPEAERRALLDAYHAHEGPIEEFWRDVVLRRMGWAAAKVRGIQTALQLADILAYDLPLLAQLRARGIAMPRDLVQLERKDWLGLLSRVGPSPEAPGDTVEEQVTRTVDAIAGVVAATYPTETLARLAATSQDVELAAARNLLSRFFEREAAKEDGTGFDMRTSPVTTYLEQHGDRIFQGLGPDDKATLTSQLQRLQRVFRLSGDRPQAEALLELGLDSAFRVTRFSPQHFCADFGARLGGVDSASLVYARAEKIAGTILYLYTDLWQNQVDVKPATIEPSSAPRGIGAVSRSDAAISRSQPDEIKPSTRLQAIQSPPEPDMEGATLPPEPIVPLKDLPAYRELFGTLQLCDCVQCQSFYSPAAYFVDLLHMLDRKDFVTNPAKVLFRRRPDLEHIQLTCENTNTLIPYVDLVTEVLESLVANGSPTPFNVPPGPPNQKLPSPSAEDLRVNPIYLTTDSSTFADQAYAALQQAVFPLTLPLNLPLETTRAYLQHLGVNRSELMALFDRDPGLEATMARTAEVLLLSPQEFELITGATFGGDVSSLPGTIVELFGLSLAPTPSTTFNHAAPEFVLNATKPDDRAALIRSLQNILGIVSSAPVPVTGEYDAPTVAAVKAFLTEQGLPPNGTTDEAFWGAMESSGMPSLSVMLCPVPMFLERSGLSYEELIALVKTRFVNPTLQGQGDFDYLARLHIPAADVRAWIDAGLTPSVPAPIQAALGDAAEDAGVFTSWVQRRTRAVVINTGFVSPCDLDQATLMHLDGTLLSPGELVTLFRAIRLWRKLGWSLTDLDYVLEPGGLDSSTVFETLRLLANVKQLHDRMQAPIAQLATLWQKIPTHGYPAVYDRLFRNRAAQLIDPILDLDRERSEIEAATSTTPPALSDHVGPVLAAFRLSAQDLTLLRAGLDDDPNLPPASRPQLNLASLSAIYRHVSLARALSLPLSELLALIRLSGLAVFERPNRLPRADALAFLDIVEKVQASGVKVGALDYLCEAVPQPEGLLSTRVGAWSRTTATLVDGLRAIAFEQPIEDDPNGDELTARLTALVGAEDAAAATALIYGRDVYRANLSGLPSKFPFPAALGNRVSYDANGAQLQLRGAMTTVERGLLLAAAGVPAEAQAAYTQAVQALDAQPRAFVARALKAMFAPAEAEAALIEVSSLDGTGAPISAVIDAKIADILSRRRGLLARSLIKQTFTTTTELAADVVGLLLENETVLTSLVGAGPAMNDYQALDGDGLDAEYFANSALAGPTTVQQVDEAVGFDLRGAAPAPGVPATGFSVRWRGSLYVPATGEVNFRARCSDGIQLTVNDVIVIDEWRDQSETEFHATLRLDGAQFYPLEVRYYNKTGDALVELGWSSPAIPASVIPKTSLYSSTRFDSILQRIERIYKIALFLAPFKLESSDVQRLTEHGNLELGLMPLRAPITLAAAQALFQQWLGLYDFAALRDRYPPSDVSLTDVLLAPTASEALERFVKLSGAELETITAAVDVFTARVFDTVTATWRTDEPDLTAFSWCKRIAETLALVQRTGAAPRQLFEWAKAREIKELPTGPETLWRAWTTLDADKKDRQVDNARYAQGARDLVRARYDEARWRAEATTLNDSLRVRRRSALTAFVLAMPDMMRAHVSDTGRLFEFLLIDVEMDPCMQTSRIKQGISSVQLFVQRVLLNFESPAVPPSCVDRARWEWMKAYRVWEANRKVFLYPESYLEEELRDDKTPFFKEFESELLQDDLNDANAERAFRHYLEKLDGVAKLIVCGTCVDNQENTLHVFGRTSTMPFVFYHRRIDAKIGSPWTEGVWSPWQKLPVDVATIDDGDNSGAHLLPVVWNRRLYLFWPLFEQKPDDATNATLPDGFDPINYWQIKLAWSEYKDGQWSAKQTGAPFIVSSAVVETLNGKKFWDSGPDPDPSYQHGPYQPSQVTSLPTLIPEGAPPTLFHDPSVLQSPPTVIPIPGETKIVPVKIDDDEMLRGTKLEQIGDWARHVHSAKGTIVRSVLPLPIDHYLEVRSSGSALSILVFRRFLGIQKGQSRIVIEDSIVVVRGGERTDRIERSQIDAPAPPRVCEDHSHVGTFEFPACSADIVAFSSGQSVGNYNDLPRPQSTTNAFMGLRCGFRPMAGVSFALQLPSNASPVLGVAPTPFEVIDTDNKGGFDSNAFFYQDQRRCYLVTRPALLGKFGWPNVFSAEPDARATVAERSAVLVAAAEGNLGIAPGAPLRENPWVHAALGKWAAGPALPETMRSPTAAALLGLNGAAGGNSIASSKAKKVAESAVARVQPEYTFTPHWHPYTCPFIGALMGGGLPGLFTLENQNLTDVRSVSSGASPSGPNNFVSTYQPDLTQVVQPNPLEIVDFGRTGAYSQYNRETFFHAPLTVSTLHCRRGDYEDALRWLHFVYQPTTDDTDSSAQRVWRFAPFRTADTPRIEETLGLLTYTGNDPLQLKKRANLEASIQEWIEDPFNPHLIARRRPVAYMKNVVMKYLDILIAWGDELFSRDTIESINEATQLYVFAANLLGPRTQRAPAPGAVRTESYHSLRDHLDKLSNVEVDLETRLPFTQVFGGGTGATGQLTKLPKALYFCLPQNDDMLAYWDTIVDRLFKIRHCMSLDGTVRQLPLFEPPIDPMLLVEAVAHGLDIGSVLNDLYAPLPRYRFTFMLQQALALCSEVRALGSTLLSVLEKRDAEMLSLLRSEHERQLLDQVKTNKKLQIDESEETLQALENTKRIMTARIEYYEKLIAQGLISEETDQLRNLDRSDVVQQEASAIEAEAQVLSLIPNTTGGTLSGTTFGGSNLGAAASAIGRVLSSDAASYSYKANRASITGGHARRAEDWRFQRDQAKRELSQVERQQTASRIRKELAQADLRNHETAIEHARGIEEVLRNKFTNEGRYAWMESQIRSVHFQCYQAAYEIAKRAERCWRYERGAEATFIKYGAWDSSMRGLLAGEQLYLQLKQMERAYQEQQTREFEITKHISALQLDPFALIALKETGACELEIPEWVFDLDYPGHYFRRLKTVSITIPAVVGPYTSVSATVTLLSSKVRESSRVVGTYGDDENYRPDHLPVEAVAASSAQNDSGRFQLDFRDEKYLPFEGAGAIGRWRIELPKEFRSFDYDTISDVILHLKYTSRRDETLSALALGALRDELKAAAEGPLLRLFSLRHEFPNEWHALKTSATRTATITVTKNRFPLLAQYGTITVNELQSVLILKEPASELAYEAQLTPGAAAAIDFEWSADDKRYRHATKASAVTLKVSTSAEENAWQFQIVAPTSAIELELIRDMVIIARYSVAT